MFFENGLQIDQLAGSLTNGGSAIVKEVEIRCFDGYELTCEVIGNLTVEAKHDDDVGYTNIEVLPYDLSAFAGTDQPFQLRFTPGAVNGTYSFKFRNGPPVVVVTDTQVFNDDEDPVFNDEENFVYTE